MAIEYAGAVTASSNLTSVTSGSAGVKGSYTELIASTARESKLITVSLEAKSADSNYEVFIAVGAVASEVDQFSISFWGNTSGVSVTDENVTFPFTIAASARVSIACLSTDGSAVVGVSIALSDDASYGTSTQATLVGMSGGQGTDVDPGSSANTKGAWTEISASAPHDMDFLVFCIGQSNNASIGTGSTFLIDIGTGAASSEVVLVENIFHSQTATETGSTWYPIYAPISSGDRIAVRGQSTETDALDRIFDGAILGVNITAPSGGGVSQALAY